ncbi:hypothetical protein VIGAN_07098100 [Vigna angularis var. angularis]|uniref:Pectinesterase n=2 Tax=Phaseolus angularis TaxID=3914 RepID=A0A0S3SHI1_PHAAN|nr:pectinesterase [Vigna angularis]BAT92289.1 hypothetical protein VIGAN_07098100 [Vigna angularis var. angularis]
MSERNVDKGKRIIIGVSTLFLVAVVGAIVFGFNLIESSSNGNGDKENVNNKNQHVAASVKAVQTLCLPTNYKEECEKNLMTGVGDSTTTDPYELIKLAFNITIEKITDKFEEMNILHDIEKEPRAKMALETCKQLMDLSVSELERSFIGMSEFNLMSVDKILMNLKVWLSGALTYQDTCLDEFENTTSDAGKKMQDLLTTGMHMTSNGLSIITALSDTFTDFNATKLLGRRLLQDSESPSSVDNGGLNETLILNRKPNVTVAKDGSGDFITINEALNSVPRKNKTPFVIYIKEGIYQEYVEVKNNMTHVVFIGDGGKKTRITGNKNYIDGITTYKTATVAIQGDNFVAMNMGFENSAGAEKHQAVALRVQADKSVFFNCSMDGYQDTLYVHTLRQYYRDCTISGTIDFVFGNALAVFQNCTFVVRKPMENQQCIVTAQGRKEKEQPSAIVIQGGSIVADPEFYPVRFVNKAYLARPWKIYSRTIFMDTYIDDLIQGEGYLPWQALEGPIGMDTCFYAEYHNTGPGSDKSKRVNWNGILNLNSKAARLFSPSKFFHGLDWVRATGVPCFPSVPPHYRHKQTILPW